MAVCRFFGQEIVGIEHVGIRERHGIAVDFKRADDDRRAHRQGDVSGGCKTIKVR